MGIQLYNITLPSTWLIVSLVITSASVVSCFIIQRLRKNLRRNISICVLVEVIFVILCMTVLCRQGNGEHEFELIPFLRYIDLFQTDLDYYKRQIVEEALFNILMFIPVGILGGLILYHKGRNRIYVKILLMGFCVSLIIESLQLILCRGCCETNDLIHNTLGCLIGYVFYKFARLFFIKYSKTDKKMTV